MNSKSRTLGRGKSKRVAVLAVATIAVAMTAAYGTAVAKSDSGKSEGLRHISRSVSTPGSREVELYKVPSGKQLVVKQIIRLGVQVGKGTLYRARVAMLCRGGAAGLGRELHQVIDDRRFGKQPVAHRATWCPPTGARKLELVHSAGPTDSSRNCRAAEPAWADR